MAKDQYDLLLDSLAAQAREGGLIIRCESYGVLAMMHPRHAQEEDKQPHLALPVEDREERRSGGQGIGESEDK